MSITITMNKISYCILHIILYAELSWHHWPVLSWLNSLESIDHIDHVVHFLDWNECLGSHVATISGVGDSCKRSLQYPMLKRY